MKTGEIIEINNDLSIKNYSWGFFIQNKINTTKKSKYILAGSDKEKYIYYPIIQRKIFFR